MRKTRNWISLRYKLQVLSLLLSPVSVNAVSQLVLRDDVLADSVLPAQFSQNQVSQNQTPQRPESENVVNFHSKFFPDLATSSTPLTVRKKFNLFAKNSVSLGALVGSTFGATIGQARNSLEGYGQGVEGYAKRFGSSMASGATTNFFGTFLIPSLTRQDPRSFVLPKGSLGKHVVNAANNFVYANKDGGGKSLNWGGLLGPLGAEVVANSYLPVREQTGARTMARYGTRQASRFGINCLKELWPSIIKKLTGK